MARIKEGEERLTRLHKTEMAIKEADRVLEQKVQSLHDFKKKIAVLKQQLAETKEQLKQYKDSTTMHTSPPSPLTQESDTANPAPTREPDGGQYDMAR